VLGLEDGRGVKEEGGVVPEVDDDAVSLSRRDDAEEPEPGIGWSAEGVPVINIKYIDKDLRARPLYLKTKLNGKPVKCLQVYIFTSKESNKLPHVTTITVT
jgi:hypothetical protein